VTFHVLPDPPTAPVQIAALQRGPAMTFVETASGTPASMTLRILRLGLNDGSPTAGLDPGFWISAGGPAELVAVLPGKVSILNQNDAVVATAAYAEEPFDVYRIDITVQRPGSTWSLQIQNNENQQRNFTAVVADTDDGARQPWIKAPSTLQLTAPPGTAQPVTGTVNVVNYGTGPLTIQPTGLSDPFAVIPPPEDVVPNSLGQLTIQYDPNKTGLSQQTLSIVSNDTTAGAQPAHNQVVAVSYQTTAPPPPPPPPPPTTLFPCTHRDGCGNYSRPPFGGPCQTHGCGHPQSDHRADYNP
jgi:hypothetical protein